MIIQGVGTYIRLINVVKKNILSKLIDNPKK